MTDVQTLIEEVEAHAGRTTISGAEYQRRLAAGKYRDPLNTEWGQIFDKLARAKALVTPELPVLPGPNSFPSKTRP